MQKSSIRIIFMGTPGFAVTQLARLIDGGYNIVAVVTAPDKPAGRGMNLTGSEVKEFAVSKGIPVLQPVSLKNDDFISELSSYNADLFIVVAFRMLPKVVWSMPGLGTFNLHASLLPDYRGAAPINHAIINGETLTGVTTFMLDEEIDTGEMLFRQECRIEPEDDFGTLHDKLMNIGSSLIIKSVDEIISGNARPVLQATIEARMGDLHLAPKLTKETGRIKWNSEPEKIHNLVRGLSPYPAAHTILSGKGRELPVKIFRTSFSSVPHDIPSGTIDTDGKRYLKVACKDGFIEIHELQVAGKKRVAIREFLAGFRDSGQYVFI